MIQGFSGFREFLQRQKIEGCFADTTVLFAFSYPLDQFNADSEFALEPLSEANIPLFSNMNVRAEFLENHRRVLIAEGLIDFLEDLEPKIDGALAEKLKSHRTSYRRKVSEEKSAKIDPNQIRFFRKLLKQFKSGQGNGWELFCRSYLSDRLDLIWKTVEQELNMEMISVRDGDNSPLLESVPQWEGLGRLKGLLALGKSMPRPSGTEFSAR